VRKPLVRILALAAVALTVLVVGTAGARRGETTLISRGSGAGPGANLDSLGEAISADGRYLAFHSPATNLPGVDPYNDVYMRDTLTGALRLVSRPPGAQGAVADQNSFNPSLSAAGRYVAFDSIAANLSDEDANLTYDVFVRDMADGSVEFASRATGGVAGNGSSRMPSLSAGGRYVAFTTGATNLGGDGDTTPDVYRHDLRTGMTELVSRRSGPAGAKGTSASTDAAISGNGRYVAFVSDANNLSDEDDNSTRNVFVRDLDTDQTILVSRATGLGGAAANGFTPSVEISAGGRYAVFHSAATNLATGDVSGYDVFRRDLVTGATVLVSRRSGAAGAPGDAPSIYPSISRSGRYVSFRSAATNFSGADTAFEDIFVRDLVAGTTKLVSRRSGRGPAADAISWDAVISDDGRRVAFESNADNLSGADKNAVRNIFLRDVLGPAQRCGGKQATLAGSPGADVLRGTARRDVIAARGGDDRVLSRGSGDLVCGGPGRDRLLGAAGADRLRGGPGRDSLLGGPARDLLLGGPGRDLLLGEKGRDRCRGGAGPGPLA
jgi:Tol biopolymer transport system component